MSSAFILFVLVSVCVTHSYQGHEDPASPLGALRFSSKGLKMLPVPPFSSRNSSDQLAVMEEFIYPLNSSESGFIQTSGTGVSVSKGARALLKFSITITAVAARTLSQSDAPFIETLNETEQTDYLQLNSSYSGSLDIPFLSWIGANLTQNVTKKEMFNSALGQDSYIAKAAAAGGILKNATSVNVSISGTRSVVGNSFIPVSVFTFIKIARVNLVDGSSLIIVSSSGEDIAVASSEGTVVATGADTFEMVEETHVDSV